MNGYIEQDESDEAIADLLEDIESDEAAEIDETEERRRRGLRPFRPRVPTGRGLYKPRPAGNFVTQVQLQTALARVGGQIKTNADATKALSTRVNTVSSRVDAEVGARKKETAAIKKEVASARQMGILPLLLQRPPQLEITRSGTAPTSPITNVTVKNTPDNLLPLVLLMGSGGFGGSDGKSSDDTMLLAVALIATQK